MEKMSFLKKESFKFGALVIFVAGTWILTWYFGLKEKLESAISGAANFGPVLPAIFIAAYVALVVSLMPSSPLNIASGIVFGPLLGFIYSWLGVMLGGAASFLLARFLGESFVSKFVREKSKLLDRYNQKISEDGFSAALLFRIIPFFPMGGFNYLFGLSKIKFKSYLLASGLGVIPGVFILSFFGNSILNPTTFNIFVTAFLLVLTGIVSFAYKKKSKI